MDIICYTKKNIDAILVALVLSVNVLRFFLNIGETNMLLYMIYVFCIIALWQYNKKHVLLLYKNDNIIKYNIQYWILCIIYSLITCVVKTTEFTSFFKFVVAIIIGLLCLGEDTYKKRTILLWFYSINIIYGILLTIYPEKAYSYMGLTEANYLNMTLTLGYCFTISLVEIVCSLYNSKYLRMIFASGLSIFFFLVLMLFAARGVLLFPPIIMILVAFLKGGKQKRKLALLLFLSFIMILCAVQYFQENMSGWALSHMTRLFEDSDEESRFDVWSSSIKAMLDNLWIYWGAGFNGQSHYINYYPHNIFLQFLGDFGLLFLLGFISLVNFVIKKFRKSVNTVDSFKQQEIIIICFSGFLYYLLTFCKSFSMYDSCPMLIMISLCLSSNVKGKYISEY